MSEQEERRPLQAGQHPPGDRTWLGVFRTALILGFEWVRGSVKRDRRPWLIGITTVAMVVTFVAILQSAIESSSVIFLRLAEDQASEIDMSLNAEVGTVPTGMLPLLNFTALAPALAASPAVRGSAPRWLALAPMSSKAQPAYSSNAYVLGIDSALEAEIGLGRGWKRRPLGEGECYASSSLLDELNVRGGVGERIVMRFGLSTLANVLGASALLGGGSGNQSSTAVNYALLERILAGGGLDLSENVTISVNGLTALQIALGGAGLNVSEVVSQNPALAALGLVQINVAPLLRASLVVVANSLDVAAELTVVDSVSDPAGKWPSLLGNVVVLEAQWLAVLLRDALDAAVQQLQDTLQPFVVALNGGNPAAGGGTGTGTDTTSNPTGVMAALATLRVTISRFDYTWLKQYAMQISLIWQQREEAYLYNSSKLDAALARFSDAVAMSLGFSYPVNQATPLADTLSGLSFIALFLRQIMNCIIFILVLLGSIVIYALVQGDVESNTHVLGMLRALGMAAPSLAALLSIQTLAFAVPGIILGLFMASMMNIAVAVGLGWFARLPLPYPMPGSAWALGLILGVVMPAIATVVPIRRALSGSLRDSLDLYHNNMNAITVRMEKLESLGLSPIQTALAIVLIVLGFVTYVLLPLSFILRDIAWFLGVLTGILMGMLGGLALISQALQPCLERTVLRTALFLTRIDRNLYTVVAKNLGGHRARNMKTATMMAVAAAFLVFASAMFRLQSASIVTNVQLFLGGDLVSLVVQEDPTKYSLPQQDMSAFLDAHMARNDSVVAGYTYISSPLTGYPYVRRSQLSNLVGIPLTQTRVYGIQRNYLQVAYKQFVIVTQSNEGKDGKSSGWFSGGGFGGGSAFNDPVAALYDSAGTLQLPIERQLSAPPDPLVTGDQQLRAYTCNASYDSITLGATSDWVLLNSYPAYNLTATVADAWAAVSADLTAEAQAAAQSRALAGVPIARIAYRDYSTCILACNGAAIVASSSRGGGGGCSASPSSAAPYPYTGPGAPQYAQGVPGAACYLPSACHSVSFFSREEQAARVNEAYTAYKDVLMSEALRPATSVDTDTPLQMRLLTRDPSTGYGLLRVFMSKARAMVRKMPGFVFSSYSQSAFRSPVLMRMRDYSQLQQAAAEDYASIRAYVQGTAVSSDAADGSSASSGASGTGSGSSTTATGGRLPAVPTWLNASSAWYFTAVPALPATDVPSAATCASNLTGSGLAVTPGSLCSRGGSAALDGDPATVLLAPLATAADIASRPAGIATALNETGAVYLQFDVGACALVSAVRLHYSGRAGSGSGSGSGPASVQGRWRLYALSSPAAAAYTLVGSGEARTGASEAALDGFSARYWALVWSPNVTAASPAGALPVPVPVPDLQQLLLSAVTSGARCNAEDLAADDAVLSVPKSRLIVKLKPGASEGERRRVLNGLRSAAGNAQSFTQTQDTNVLLASASSAVVGLDAFFNAVAAICLILCFFAAWLSFTANVRDNSTELGILRALGLTSAQVIRVFEWEAVTVLVSAFILGTASGLAIAITLQLQFNLFTEMPFQFQFPLSLVLLFLFAGIALALLASYKPARRLAHIAIAKVLKGHTD